MSGRRRGSKDSAERNQLIEAAAQIVEVDGAHKVTASRVAKRVGLSRHIVHYYFGTIDELLVSVIARNNKRLLRWIAMELEDRDPLAVMWDLASRIAVQAIEFRVLAAHSDRIRAEFNRSHRETDAVFVRSVREYCDAHGFAPAAPPEVIVTLIQSVAHQLVVDRRMGLPSDEDAHIQALQDMLSGAIANKTSLQTVVNE